MLQGRLTAAVMFGVAFGVSAAGGGPDLKFRFRDERAPAGGTVQMKMETTEGTPISGGRPRFAYDASFFAEVAGVGIFPAMGEAAGTAIIEGNRVAIAYATTEPFTGDYPVMTVAMRIRPDVPVGSRQSFGFDLSSLWTLNGKTVPARIDPGTVTVGGSVAISDVVPGGGWQPAGTMVSVRGVGFNSGSRLRADGISIGSVRLISPTEIQFTLRQAANLTGAEFRVDNPDLSRSIYFSYTRGIDAATSSRSLLSVTRPIFSGRTRTVATVGPVSALNSLQYAGLALQNPNVDGADVTIGLYAADGTHLYSAERSLAGGYRLALELSELLDGVLPSPGTYVRVTSSLPIEVFGVLCDEGAWTVAPRLPIEALTQ
jgi:hypothetical protein